MDKPRRVRRQKRHPWLFGNHPPRDAAEEYFARKRFIDIVDDLVDDSIAFLREEIARTGLPETAVTDTVERIKYGLLSSWALEILARPPDDYTFASGSYFMSQDEYIAQKFGIDLGAEAAIRYQEYRDKQKAAHGNSMRPISFPGLSSIAVVV